MTRSIDDLYAANEYNTKLIIEYATRLSELTHYYDEFLTEINDSSPELKEEPAVKRFLDKMEKIVGC